MRHHPDILETSDIYPRLEKEKTLCFIVILFSTVRMKMFACVYFVFLLGGGDRFYCAGISIGKEQTRATIHIYATRKKYF